MRHTSAPQGKVVQQYITITYYNMKHKHINENFAHLTPTLSKLFHCQTRLQHLFQHTLLDTHSLIGLIPMILTNLCGTHSQLVRPTYISSNKKVSVRNNVLKQVLPTLL